MVSFVCLFHGSLHGCTTASSCWCSLTTTQRQQCCSFLLLHSQNGTQRKPWCFHSQGTGIASDLSLVSPSSQASSFFFLVIVIVISVLIILGIVLLLLLALLNLAQIFPFFCKSISH